MVAVSIPIIVYQKSLPPHQQMQQSLFPKCRLPFVPSVFFRSHANIKSSCSSLYSRSPCHFEISTHYCNHRHRLLFGKPSPISTKSGLSCSHATIKMVAVSIPEILTTTSTDAAVSIPQMQTSSLFSPSVFSCSYANIKSCSSLYSRSPCHFEVSTHYCNHRHRLLFGKPSPISTNSLLQSSPPWSLLFLCDHQNGSCVYSRNPCHHINRCSSLYSPNADFHHLSSCHQCSFVLTRISKVAAVSIPGVLVTLKFQLIIAIIATLSLCSFSCLASQVQSPPKVVSLVLMRPSKW